MVKISNKPNVRGIKNVSENIDYRAKLIGKDGRLWTALMYTRVKGFGLGVGLAVLLVVVIPWLAKVLGL